MNDWRDMHNGDVAAPDWRKGDELVTMPCSTAEYESLKSQKDELMRQQSTDQIDEYRRQLFDLIDQEITLSKTTSMLAYTMGLMQARAILADLDSSPVTLDSPRRTLAAIKAVVDSIPQGGSKEGRPDYVNMVPSNKVAELRRLVSS